jgi:hypothetical protein
MAAAALVGIPAMGVSVDAAGSTEETALAEAEAAVCMAATLAVAVAVALGFWARGRMV